MKNIKKTVLLAGAAILASASVASAQIVNAQFIGEDGGGAYGTLYAGTGAVGTGTYWNSVQIPDGAPLNTSVPTPLYTNGGVSVPDQTTVTVSLTGVESFNWGALPTYTSGNSLLDSAAISVGTANFTIGGLTDGGTYNLYLFGNSGTAVQGTTFTINGVTPSQVASGNGSSGLTPNSALTDAGVDYTEFVGVVASGTGDITGSWTAGASMEANAPFNGLQIQAETPAVPEPSVTILLGLGLMGLIALRRARRLLS